MGRNSLLIFIALLFVPGCKNREEPIKDIPVTLTPAERAAQKEDLQIDSIVASYEHPPAQVEKMCWDAKWRLYCMYCDSPVRTPTLEELTYGELGLIAWIRADGIVHSYRVRQPIYEVSLEFTYKGKPRDYYISKYAKLPEPEIDCGYYYDHLIDDLDYFITNQQLPLGLGIHRSHRSTMLDPAEAKYRPKRLKKFRIDYPMQPEVIYYIRENQKKINPWFYEEAKKRGVFDSVKYPPEKIKVAIEANKNDKDGVMDWQDFLLHH